MIDLGTVRPGSTIRIPFSSFDKDDGSSITMTNYAVADILIYKDGGTTERASTAGFAATTDFDSKTGKHVAVIDLADNTTAGFFAAGSEYIVAIDAVTVDVVTTGGWIARFSIGYPNALINTTIATLATQTSFTLTVGPAEDDALNGQWVIIHDVASAVQMGIAVISDYTGSTKTVTLAAGTTFTAAATDNISIMGPSPLQPATAGRTLVVDAAGLADANAVKVGPTGSGTAQTTGDLKASLNTIDDFIDTEVAAIITTLGTPAGASVSADIAAIEAQTDDIGAAGAGLTAVPWNAAWDAEVQSEVDDALVVQRLDELLAADSDIDGAAPPTVGSVFHELMSKTAGSFTFDQTTDSNEAIRDKETDIETDTAEIGTAGAGLTNINLPNQTMDIVGNITGNLSGSVGSVTGAVGSVTGLTAATVHADLDDIQARVPAALTAGGNMKSDVLAISGDTVAADALEALMDGIIVAQVNDAGATTTVFIADGFTEATNDHFNGRLITFISGALSGQQTAITDYVGATQTFTVTALTEAPANNDFFVIH